MIQVAAGFVLVGKDGKIEGSEVKGCGFSAGGRGGLEGAVAPACAALGLLVFFLFLGGSRKDSERIWLLFTVNVCMRVREVSRRYSVISHVILTRFAVGMY